MYRTCLLIADIEPTALTSLWAVLTGWLGEKSDRRHHTSKYSEYYTLDRAYCPYLAGTAKETALRSVLWSRASNTKLWCDHVLAIQNGRTALLCTSNRAVWRIQHRRRLWCAHAKYNNYTWGNILLITTIMQLSLANILAQSLHMSCSIPGEGLTAEDYEKLSVWSHGTDKLLLHNTPCDSTVWNSPTLLSLQCVWLFV